MAIVRCFADNAVEARHVFAFFMRLESLFSANLRRIMPQAWSRRLWRPRHNTKKLRHRSSVALLLCRSSYCELSLSMFLLHHLNHLAVLTANDVDALLHGLKLTTREVVDCAIG